MNSPGSEELFFYTNYHQEFNLKKLLFTTLLITLLFTACSGAQTGSKVDTLTVMTHDSFEISAELVAAYESSNNVKLAFLKSGDTGEALNKAILSKNAPLADVFYGVDNTFLSRALEAEIFEPYNSAFLIDIPEEVQLDPDHNLLPVDYGDVCINYDKAYFSENNIPVPQTLEDLLKPEYEGLLVMENPATSSPGLAFLLATISQFGEQNYLDFWRSLRSNGLVVVGDWSTAYYTNFSASSGHGLQPLVVSYASSPAAEVFFSETPLSESPTGSITGPGTCFRQIEFVGILKGTKQRQQAENFIDFMLDVQFQEDMPLQMFVYPVNPQAELPPEFVKYAKVSEQPVLLTPSDIANHRDKWIADWVEAVLH
jgi:thiamine transport system substrate-binding protein